jgi:alkylhydroperoxidase family enzyme
MARISAKADKDYPWYLRLMYRRQRKTRGQVILPTQVWGRSPMLLRRFLHMFQAFERKSSPLDSQINHCAFCIDFNAMRVLEKGGSLDKLSGLSCFQESDKYSEAEKAALRYAESITRSDQEVDDDLFSELQSHFSDDALVELTGLIAFQNMSSKFNAALDLPAQGFCEWRADAS